MAVVHGYCTADELREHFDDSGANLTTALLERAIASASRAIDDHCGRRFWKDAAPVARLYRPREFESVFVHDIASRSGVVVATDTTGDGSFATTWDAADFDLEPRDADVDDEVDAAVPYSFWQITAIDDKVFPLHNRRATLRVTATYGWSAVPDKVNEACILKAASLFKRKDAVNGVLGFNEFGGVVRIGRRDPDVAELLQGYVRFSRPET